MPLIDDCQERRIESVRYYLQSGNDIHDRGTTFPYKGMSPLAISSSVEENHEIINLLIAHGAEVDELNDAYGNDTKFGDMLSALHEAVRAGHLSNVQALVRGGANIGLRTYKQVSIIEMLGKLISDARSLFSDYEITTQSVEPLLRYFGLENNPEYIQEIKEIYRDYLNYTNNGKFSHSVTKHFYPNSPECQTAIQSDKFDLQSIDETIRKGGADAAKVKTMRQSYVDSLREKKTKGCTITETFPLELPKDHIQRTQTLIDYIKSHLKQVNALAPVLTALAAHPVPGGGK